MAEYCMNCGTKLVIKNLENEGDIPFCTKCNEFRFPMYNVAVSMIVIDKKTDKVLLIQQYNRPFYILVAGYVNRGERVEDAVIREVKEEMGLTVKTVKFNRTKFFEPSNTLMVNFTAFVDDINDIRINSEIDSYNWFTKEEARKNIKENSLAAEFLNAYLDEVM